MQQAIYTEQPRRAEPTGRAFYSNCLPEVPRRQRSLHCRPIADPIKPRRCVRDSNGDLFGTTILGGANSDGSIYELPAGGSTITTLASMDSTTGINPSAGLILDANGNLFGTTTSDGPDGFGTVYELATGSSTITVLSSFDGDNASPGTNQLGTYPIIPSLNMDAQGNLYGVAGEGGTNNLGAIFQVSQVHATHAVVTTQPTTAIAGTTQTIGVSLESDAGLVDSSLNVPVTLSITSGPHWRNIGWDADHLSRRRRRHVF